MNFWVYVLRSDLNGKRYVGSTQNIPERLRRHNAGHSKATKPGIPWQLVHQESFPTRTQAVQRERYLKTGKGRKELDDLIR